MNVKEFVDRQDLQLDVTRRFNCPVCGGVNTLSVTKLMEGTKWMCFSASCNTRGVTNSNLSMNDIAIAMGAKAFKEVFEIPDYWVSGLINKDTVKYLQTYNLLALCSAGHIDVRYDPKQDRHVFISYNNGRISGAFGRSNSGEKPKWNNYTATDVPYIVPKYGEAMTEKVGVLVEDPVSAAAACCVMDGIGLLGTYLKKQYIPTLSEYDRLIVALDKDAGTKSLDIQRILMYYTKVDVVLLERDIKYMNPEEIKEVLHV